MYEQKIGPIIVFMGGKIDAEIDQDEGRISVTDPNDNQAFELA